MTGKTITIKLIKSPIGANQRQKKTIHALGLRHVAAIVTLPSNPATLGMVGKVCRWLEIQK
jgi:large subunit ribosomal protein L30